ncbi:hypothetical protein BDE02_03G013000 [Populus trichocarpa]|nr:hypothetical protein BDE02_03G013000 [Populus trichocarpa]
MASWLKLLQLLLSNILMVLLFVFEDPNNKQIMENWLLTSTLSSALTAALTSSISWM